MCVPNLIGQEFRYYHLIGSVVIYYLPDLFQNGGINLYHSTQVILGIFLQTHQNLKIDTMVF